MRDVASRPANSGDDAASVATGHDAFKVYRVHTVRGESAKRQMVASFVRYVEAEVFVHAELLGYATHGTAAGAFWGTAENGDHVHFWIETPQMTASASVNAGPAAH